MVRHGSLSTGRASEAIQDLRDLDLVHHEHEPLLERVWVLRDRLTAYDGVYVALAEFLSCPLITSDRKLASAAGNLISTEIIS